MRTTRDNIYQLLHDIDKLHVPKTVRIRPKSPSDIYEAIEKENFEFPIIFRKAGDHGGVSTLLVKDENEMFYAFPLDGQDYYLTQFVDYADKDGIYVKYRLVVIDGKVYLRHVMFAESWMVHARNELEETKTDAKVISKRFLKENTPSIQLIVTEIYHRLGLDYFGIDCYIDKEMNLLAFEINANMNIFIQTENSVFKKHIEMTHHALIKMMTS